MIAYHHSRKGLVTSLRDRDARKKVSVHPAELVAPYLLLSMGPAASADTVSHCNEHFWLNRRRLPISLALK